MKISSKRTNTAKRLLIVLAVPPLISATAYTAFTFISSRKFIDDVEIFGALIICLILTLVASAFVCTLPSLLSWAIISTAISRTGNYFQSKSHSITLGILLGLISGYFISFFRLLKNEPILLSLAIGALTGGITCYLLCSNYFKEKNSQ